MRGQRRCSGDPLPCSCLGPRRARLQLAGPACRWLWRAAQREPWDPDSHQGFPIGFRSAVRALLLVAHRGAAAGADGGAAAGLARLPPQLLHHVVGLAAYPLSRWQPTVEDEEEFLDCYLGVGEGRWKLPWRR